MIMRSYFPRRNITFMCLFILSFFLLPCKNVYGTETKRVLAYIGYTDTSREYPNTLAGIDSVSTNYTVTGLSDYTQLDSMLPGHDVLLIPEQEKADSSLLEVIGTNWATTVQNFVNNGGVVIQCIHIGRYQILTGSGLMNISSSGTFEGSVTVGAPSDPVAAGVYNPYTGENGSAYVTTPEGVVVAERTGYGPVVINKRMGLGHVVFIGHDYYNSNTNQNRIVGNAVFNLPVIVDDLGVSPSEGFKSSGNEGGPFAPSSKTYTLTNNGPNSLDWTLAVTESWLDVVPSSGTLAGGASTSVDVCINSNANTLTTGIYNDEIIFSNLTSGIDQGRIAQLLVGGVASIPFVEDFEAGTTLLPCWEITGTNNYRTRVTTSYDPHAGSYHLTMDSISGYSRNELTLTINLENCENVQLTFWAKVFNDEPHGPPPTPFYSGYDFDGVAISEDGYEWYEVQGLRSLSSSYTQLIVDLDTPVATYGLNYNSQFKIRFNQFDDYSITTDGITFDDIEITGKFKDDLLVAPHTGLSASGQEHGPFSPLSGIYTLTNIGPNTIDWTASVAETWLDVVPESGTLGPGDVNTVELRLNADANGLPPGEHENVAVFTNLTSGLTQSREVTLEVVPVPVDAEITDTIPPADDFNMPFGDVIIGLSSGGQITVRNTDPVFSLVVEDIFLGAGSADFYDSFPETVLNPDNWTGIEGAPTIDGVGIGEPSEPYSLRLNGHPTGGDAVISRIIDLSYVSQAQISYWYQRTGGGEDPDSGEDLILEYWNGSWVELERQLGDGPDMTTYVQSVVLLPAGALHSQFRLRIRSIGTSDPIDVFDDWFVDDVSLIKGYSATNMQLDSSIFKLENVPSLPAVIPPIGSITFDVNFAPQAVEEYISGILIATTDPNEPEVTVQLTGRGIVDYLEIPDVDLEFFGHPGGPFVPTYQYYTLTNIGTFAIDWTAEPNVPWLDVWPSGGTLPIGELINIYVAPNATAETLPEGYHGAKVVFTDITTTLAQDKNVYLNVYTEPKIWVQPYQIEVTVPQGQTTERTLTIGNSGGSPLEFDLSSQETGFEPWLLEEGTFDLDTDINDVLASAPAGHDFTVLADTVYAEGEILVRFAPDPDTAGVDSTCSRAILSSFDSNVISEYAIVPGLSLIQLPVGMTVQEALIEFNNTPGVLYAEPNYEIKMLTNGQIFPNDLLFEDLWGMHNSGQTGGTSDADIDGPEAWYIDRNCSQTIVAVLDSGVDYYHSDLASNMWVNQAEFAGTPGIDDDGNGYVDDIYGYDFADRDPDPADYHGHGTHVSGTIGAIGDNATGVTGVCWNGAIMALKVFPNYGEPAFVAGAIEAIEYACNSGARVLSNSWGGGYYNQSLKDAIERANGAGVLFVAAAGNDYGNNNDVYPHYPSSYDCENIIAVLSTNHYDEMSSFSCYGPMSVDLGAPGSDILSCKPGNQYQYMSGTSMSTPHVSGACALVWSTCSFASHLEIKDIILQTVDPTLPGLCVSGGRLNLYNALLEAEASCAAPWTTFIPKTGTVATGDSNNVRMIFDGQRPPGTYQGHITLHSNDPYVPEVLIPVELTVEQIDQFTELFDPQNPLIPDGPNSNDLDHVTLTFRPDASPSYYSLCIEEANEFPVDPDGGTSVVLGDDDYEIVPLDGVKINYYGYLYDTLYIGSNGYITFWSGDLAHFQTLEDHFALPRISALFNDLDPTAGGIISYKQLDDRIVVTYENIPEYSMGNSNSFQIEIRFNGKVRITLLDIDAVDGLVGLSDGNGLQPYFRGSDLSGYNLCTFLGDLNGDIDIDFADFAIFSTYWQNWFIHMETVRDGFNTVSYSGNDGTQTWTSCWEEVGEFDGPSDGILQVVTDGWMRIGDEIAKDQPTLSLTREANLNAATMATLTYDYVAQNNGNAGEVSVQISGNGGASWDVLAIYPYDAGSGSASFDITPYISSNTQIRFEIDSLTRIKMYLYVDNIRIEYDNLDHPWYSWCNGADFNQDFEIGLNDLRIFCEHWLE
jgi:subtilisin family serine protease